MRRLLVIVVPIVLVLASCSTSSDPTATYTGFPEGTTPEQVYDDGIFAVVSRNPGAIGEKFPPTALGAEYDLTVTFSESGQHGINCFEFGGPATEADHVTMFTVNG